MNNEQANEQYRFSNENFEVFGFIEQQYPDFINKC